MEDIEHICAYLKKNPQTPWQVYADSLGLSFPDFLSSVYTALSSSKLHDDLFSPQEVSQTILAIGGATVDLITRLHEPMVIGHALSSTFVKVLGGVARNIVDNLARLGVTTELLVPVGQDADGQLVIDALSALSINTRFISIAHDLPTAAYMAVLNHDGSLHLFAIYAELLWQWFENQLMSSMQAFSLFWQHYPIWLCDLHFSSHVMRSLIDVAHHFNRDFYIVAVSERSMHHLPENLHGLTGLILNSIELSACVGYACHSDSDIERGALLLHQRGAENVFVTCGAKGVMSLDKHCQYLWHQPSEEISPVDVTGAGDAFTAGLLAAQSRGAGLTEAVRFGMMSAERVIQHMGAICPELTPDLLIDYMKY